MGRNKSRVGRAKNLGKKQRTKKRNKELSKPWVGGTGVVSFRSSSGVNSVCRRVGCYEF